MNYFKIFICLPLLLSLNVVKAESGYKKTDISSQVEKINLKLSELHLECTETDMWGQSVLSLQSSHFVQFSRLGLGSVSYLIDGDCQDVREKLLEKFNLNINMLEVTVYFNVFEYIEWGMVGQGSPSATPYCDKTLNEFIYLDGLGEENSYAYQASKKVFLGNMDYAYCLSLKN